MYDFIGMPINLGCDHTGVELAPKYVRDNLKDLFEIGYIRDLGDIPCANKDDILLEKFSTHQNIKFFHPILKASELLSIQVKNSISNNRIPIICGGDHVSAFGSIAGVALNKGINNYAVIYIDAHGDFNTEIESPSGNMHGMHISFLMGLGESKAVHFFESSPLLDPKNIYFIGSRALDEGEIITSEKHDMHIITSIEAENMDVKKYIATIIEDIKSKNIEHIHISLDIDAIDPKYAPGTGVPEKNGMTPQTIVVILNELKKSGLCKSIDFVEFNPCLDRDNLTANIYYKLIKTFLQRNNIF